MPRQFGRFWLHEKIGHGGMAEIFRASVGPDPDNFAFDLALKRLHNSHRSDHAQVDMFLTEADVSKFLRHPNLIQTYEAGFIDDWPYIAMEYVWGIDLERLMDLLRHRRSRFPADLAVVAMMQVLRGLDYIHRARTPGGEPMEMIHRDVTPSNLYVTFAGNLKIGDFGIARIAFDEPRDEPNVVKGKASYIPPEVLKGALVSQPDDLYGLAICLYEMLTGRPVYEGLDEAAIISREVRPRLPPIHRVNPEIDTKLSAILRAALSPSPKRRPRDAAAFYRKLKGYLVSEGIQVGSKALARFVRAATGTSTTQAAPSTTPTDDVFESPHFQNPVGPTFTQRWILIQRRRRRLWPIVAAAAVIGLGVATVLLLDWIP